MCVHLEYKFRILIWKKIVYKIAPSKNTFQNISLKYWIGKKFVYILEDKFRIWIWKTKFVYEIAPSKNTFQNVSLTYWIGKKIVYILFKIVYVGTGVLFLLAI